MPNTYIARGVTLTTASLSGGGGEVVLTDGGGTFTVDGRQHRLEITSGQLKRPLRKDEPVNASGIATVRPPAIGAFPIQETMSVQTTVLPIVLDGPIFLTVKGVHEQAAAAAQ